MRILGVDPGPTGIAWAVVDMKGGRTVVGGECVSVPCAVSWGTFQCAFAYASDHVTELMRRFGCDIIAIEDFAGRRMGFGISKHGVATAKMVGALEAGLEDCGKSIVMLYRQSVVTALTGDSRSSVSATNRALNHFVMGLDRVQRGLQTHHRAAAACAYIAAGRIPR